LTWRGALTAVAVTTLIGVGCSSPAPASPPAAAAVTAKPAAPAASSKIVDAVNYSKPDREQYLYDCAKQEGQVVYYTSSSAAEKSVKPAFEKKYPGLSMSVYTATSEVVQRLIEEETAGRHNFDVYGDIHGNIERDDKFFVSFDAPSRAKIQEQLQSPYFVGTRGFFMSVIYNPKLVSAAEVPKSWQEMLDPKWKGKIFGASDTSAAVVVGLLKQKFGLDFVKSLAKNVQVNAGMSSRGVADMVAAGQVPLGWDVSSSYYKTDTLDKGASLMWVPMDPVLGLYSTDSISKHAPHPCGAALLIDWLLGDEGQTLYTKLGNSSPIKGAKQPYDLPGFPFETWKIVYNTDPSLIQGYPNYQAAAQDWQNLFQDVFIRAK
jgi:iron(III) transport system substrate-binding protein